MKLTRVRDGYVFLLTVLFVGVIASAVAITLTMLGIAMESTSQSIAQSMQAYENARSCIERALLDLRTDPTAMGNSTITLPMGSCTLGNYGGYGNANRTICATGNFKNITRMIEVQVRRLYPSVRIAIWRDTTSFTLCN